MSDTGISKVRNGKAVIRAALPTLATDRQGLRLSLDGFRVEGDPRLAPEAFNEILAPWKGRELSFEEYEQAIHSLAAYLRENGHPAAQVRMSRAVVGNGQIMIAIEGLSAEKPVVAAAEVKPGVEVQDFKITGATLVPEAELQALLIDLKGRALSAAEMEQAAQIVANHLRAKGYPLVQAYLPPQRVDGGVVEIAVMEGRLDGLAGRNGVTTDSKGERVNSALIEEFVARGTKPGEPLRMADLERGVLLASDLPGVKSVKTEIIPGTQPGTTQIKAVVEEGELVSGSIWADNFGNRFTGENRLLGQFLLNSPFGGGEQFSLNLVNSSSAHSVRVGVQAPVGSDGWRVGASMISMRSEFGLQMRTIDLNSQADIAALNVTYPLLRSALENVNLAAGYERKRFITDLAWGRENDRRINTLSFAAHGDLIDSQSGQNRWAATFTHGDTDLSAHAMYQSMDRVTAQTEGAFSKFNYQISRLAPIDNDWSWLVALSGQYANKNLDGAEKFQLGGPSGVRAYPTSEGIGDKGWLANAELRYRLAKNTAGEFHLFGFLDAGGITQYARPWVGALTTQPNSYELKGAGIGANWALSNTASAKLMYAKKIGENPNPTAANTDSDGTSRNGRIWIVANIVF